MQRNYTKKVIDRGYRLRVPVRGLKIVHIGQDVWKIGKVNKKTWHQVIYGPDNKEYHLDKSIIRRVEGYCVNKHGNTADQSKVKIYILTEILDSVNNWEFDLNNVPTPGRLKVIYDNGTIKNIDFDGDWTPFTPVDSNYKTHHPIGYRKN